jgi:L-2,4-diaminobutyrate decarboxylase
MSQMRIFSGASPEQVAADLAPLVDFQEEGLSLDTLDDLLAERLIPHLLNYELPQFQSMYNAYPEEGAALGAKLALAHNPGVTNWQISPGAAMLEELCGRSLCCLFGLAPTADATFTLAGTYANLHALYMALHRKAQRMGFNLADKGLLGFEDPSRLVVVCSRDAHFSLKHAVRTMGLGDRCLVTVDVGENRRMDVQRLDETLNELGKTKDVFCLVATAGTTSTGSVDPILPVVEMAGQLGAWSHVDGAYGLIYSLLPERKPLFAGMELADSVCWDPHKQFRVLIPSSLLFVRRWEDFGRFTLHSDYFNRERDVEPNPGLKSMPSTRPFSALSLTTSIRHRGLGGVRQNLRAPLKAIKSLAAYLETQDDLELCHEPDTGILCFRITPQAFPDEKLNQLQEYVYDRIMTGGERTVSMTKLDGKTVLRLVVISPLITSEDLIETMSAVRDLANEY